MFDQIPQQAALSTEAQRMLKSICRQRKHDVFTYQHIESQWRQFFGKHGIKQRDHAHIMREILKQNDMISKAKRES